MAITYPRTLGSLTYLYVYDSSAASWSSNRADTSLHDLFPDDATINDAIYFSANQQRFSGLSVNVGTPLAASSITVAWEYYDVVSGAWAALTVTDNTNAFQNSGVNTVDFVPPMRWGAGYSANDPAPASVTTRLWIRCRITAVSGLTEGGAVTAAVQQKQATVIVTGTTGALMAAVYAASISGSWGILTRQASFDGALYYYQLAANIQLGDGSTPTTAYIEETLVEIPDAVFVTETANATLTVGTAAGAPILVFKHGSAGNRITHSGSVLGVVVVSQHIDYVALMQSSSPPTPSGLVSTGSSNGMGLVTHYPGLRWGGSNYGARWDVSQKVRGYLSTSYGWLPRDSQIVRATPILASSGNAHALIADAIVENASSNAISNYNGSGYYLVTVNVSELNGRDLSAASVYYLYVGSNSTYRCHRFSARVTDSNGNPINGASVVLTDVSGNPVYGFNTTTLAAASGPLTTDANGYTSNVYLQQYRFYYAAGTGYFKICDSRQDFAPYQATISASGYPTVTVKGIALTGDTRLTVTLASTGGVIVIED